VDLVVDATGLPGSFGSAVEMLRDGGRLIEVGAVTASPTRCEGWLRAL